MFAFSIGSYGPASHYVHAEQLHMEPKEALFNKLLDPPCFMLDQNSLSGTKHMQNWESILYKETQVHMLHLGTRIQQA